MSGVDLFHREYWMPFKSLGFASDLLFINKDAIIATWAVLGIIVAIIVLVRIAFRDKSSVVSYLAISVVEAFKDLVEQNIGSFNFNHFCFIASIFCFILLCNLISLIPFLEEPTSDFNTTLALGLCSFVYVQASNIRAHGVGGYLKEFIEPVFLMFPLHVVGLLANIVSISFRLFGNILGGFIISNLYVGSLLSGRWFTEILGIMTGLNIIVTLFFTIFEGFIQAFVFSMLSLTYISIAVAPKEHE